MAYAFENLKAWQEAYNQLIIASDLEYISKQSLEVVYPQIDTVARMLNGLRASLIKKLDTPQKQ